MVATTSAKATTSQALCRCRKWGTSMRRSKCHCDLGRPSRIGPSGALGRQHAIEDGLQQQDAKGVEHAHQWPTAGPRAAIPAYRAAHSAAGAESSSCRLARLAQFGLAALLQMGMKVHPSIVSGPTRRGGFRPLRTFRRFTRPFSASSTGRARASTPSSSAGACASLFPAPGRRGPARSIRYLPRVFQK